MQRHASWQRSGERVSSSDRGGVARRRRPRHVPRPTAVWVTWRTAMACPSARTPRCRSGHPRDSLGRSFELAPARSSMRIGEVRATASASSSAQLWSPRARTPHEARTPGPMCRPGSRTAPGAAARGRQVDLEMDVAEEILQLLHAPPPHELLQGRDHRVGLRLKPRQAAGLLDQGRGRSSAVRIRRSQVSYAPAHQSSAFGGAFRRGRSGINCPAAIYRRSAA